MNYTIGLDIGGTNIKTALVDAHGNILVEDSRPTEAHREPDIVTRDIEAAIEVIKMKAKLPEGSIKAVGVGCPGTIDSEENMVLYANNLGWHDYPLGQKLEQATGLPVCLGNDANVAALGEALAGSAKGASSAVIITLGTGVGAGVILNGRIHTGYNLAASEFGHMVIKYGGEPCTCGRLGCFEAYAAAPGLTRQTRAAMAKNPQSIMNRIATQETADGRTAFEAMKQGDDVAARVVDQYIDYLACGLANIINGLQPEIMSLGGGVANQGETLLAPLREKVFREVYGGTGDRYTQIVSCTLGYKAGIIGAGMLAATSL